MVQSPEVLSQPHRRSGARKSSKLSWVGLRGWVFYTLTLITNWLWAASAKRCDLEQSSVTLSKVF